MNEKNKRHRKLHLTLALLLIPIFMTGLLLGGCGEISSPTSPEPQEQNPAMWNPQPGDQVVPGRNVPILNQGYWENDQGQQINPLLGDLFGIVFRLLGFLGGTVNLGLHSYTIPVGAVTHPILFSLQYASGTGVGVDCGPSPLEFNHPVTLRLSYRYTQYDEPGPPPNLQIFYVHPNGTLEAIPSTVNANTKTVTAQVDHFSRYILA